MYPLPPGQTLDTYLTLGEKNIGPGFDTFSPGTEYHFARNSFFSSGLKAQSSPFFPVVKERPGSTPVLLVTNKYYSC
jgi:hypothetical protein